MLKIEIESAIVGPKESLKSKKFKFDYLKEQNDFKIL